MLGSLKVFDCVFLIMLLCTQLKTLVKEYLNEYLLKIFVRFREKSTRV